MHQAPHASRRSALLVAFSAKSIRPEAQQAGQVVLFFYRPTMVGYAATQMHRANH